MFIVVKACFLVGLICFSFCEALAASGLLPGIFDPLPNPSGPKSLVPLINLTLVIELPESKCCPSCNPPATCKPCPQCSPVTTCKPCPPPTTCPACPKSPTCPTCKTCPPPTTCPTCKPCSTPTACPAAPTCPPDYEKICGDENAIYCADAGLCITTVFSPRNYSLAKEKCKSLTSLNFGIINQQEEFVNDNTARCIRRAVPTMVVDDSTEALWSLDSNGICSSAHCTVFEDDIFNCFETPNIPCDSQLPFYCVAKL